MGDVEVAVAELTRWVEAGGVDAVNQEGGDVLDNTALLYHSDWDPHTKLRAAKLEAAALTGLDPRDIRPVVVDLETAEDMLVDSGSVVCLEPAKPGKRANGTPDPSIKLTTASGKRLVCYGKRDRTINVGGKKIVHTFIIAEVGKTILGSDFLLRFGFAIDYHNKCLTYQPGNIDEYRTPFRYHNLDQTRGEVHSVTPQNEGGQDCPVPPAQRANSPPKFRPRPSATST